MAASKPRESMHALLQLPIITTFFTKLNQGALIANRATAVVACTTALLASADVGAAPVVDAASTWPAGFG